jgi:hypothetical protein
MEKINYKFTSVQPVHTGADKSLGILKQLRRGKVALPESLPVLSRFRTNQQNVRRSAIALFLLRLWYNIEDRARVTIYNEVRAKLIASTSARNKEEFFTLLCDKLGILSVRSTNSIFETIDILQLFDHEELFQIIRNENQWIMALFRKMKDEYTEANKGKKKEKSASGISLFGTTEEEPDDPITELEKLLLTILTQKPEEIPGMAKCYEHVPEISGNSIRGLLRRLVMYDFCEITGISSLDAKIYHQLFTGGTLSESTGLEDIEKREEFGRMCPAIKLFGSAIGNMTIQGDLIVGMAKLLCSENGTGKESYRNFVDIQFGTRLDSEKTEDKIDVRNEDGKETHQMFYEYEVYIPGTVFEHSFGLRPCNDVVEGCFHRMLQIFCANPYICAKSSVGNGEIDLSALEARIDNRKADAYIAYLIENKEAIQRYFK